jgi:hypothetical protein
MPEPQGDVADRRWAAEQAPRLLAKARAEALEEAHRRLRGRLVDALMSAATAQRGEPPARAREEPPQGGQARARAEPPTRSEPEGLGLWVYGVVNGEAPDPSRRQGVDGRHDVELIRHAGLAALASAVPLDEFREDVLEERLEDLEYLEALARAHERVLDDVLAAGPVVPLRICTIYESADRVREMLERERAPLADALHRLSGTTEWGVKAYLGAGDEAPADTAAAPGSASGVDYLARKRDQRDAADAAQRAADATVEKIHRRLSELAIDAVLSPPQDPRLSGQTREMLLNAAYLVPKARTDEFQSLVRILTRRHAPDGIVVELTGPWPAYHFAGSAAAV